MPTPQPTSTLRSTRPDIAGSMTEFSLEMNRKRMIAPLVMPEYAVPNQAGQFGKIPIEQLMKATNTKRTSGSGYNRINFDFEDDTYSCKENGIEMVLDNRNASIYRDWFDGEVTYAGICRNTVLVNYEKRVADLIIDENTHNTAFAGAAVWTNLSSATPVADVEGRVQALYDKGIMANCLIVSWKTYRNLRNTDEVIDRIKSDGAGDPAKPSDVTINMLKSVFDLDYILVGGAQENTANEADDASLSAIWSDNTAAVTRIAPPGAEIVEPCVGRTFHYTGNGSMLGGTVETYEEPQTDGEVIRFRHDTDEKLLYSEAIELINLDATS